MQSQFKQPCAAFSLVLALSPCFLDSSSSIPLDAVFVWTVLNERCTCCSNYITIKSDISNGISLVYRIAFIRRVLTC
jgi:hypothetical protein